MPDSRTDGPDGDSRTSAKDEGESPSQSLIQHRTFICVLMVVLVSLILLVNAMRTDASPSATPPVAPTAEADSEPELEMVVTVRQLEGVLLANFAGGSDAAWRVVAVEGSVCDSAAFESGATITGDNLLVLEMSDVGKRHCFEALAEDGSAVYRLSDTVVAFPAVAIDTGQALEVVDVRNYDDVLIARANRPVYWQAVVLPENTRCSEESFAGIEASTSKMSLAVDYPLSDQGDGGLLCFQAYDHLERAFRAIHSSGSAV